METFLQKITAMSEELRAVPNITALALKTNRATRASVIDVIEKQRGVKKMNPMLLSLFLESNGFDYYWEYKPSDQIMTYSESISGGEMNVPDAVKIYSLPTQDLIWFDWMAEMGTQGPAYLAFCQKLRMLDNLLHSTDSVFIVMTPEWLGKQYGYTHPRLIYWDTKGAKFLLTLTLEEYFEACLEAKAYTGWQCFYIDVAAMDISDPFVNEYFGNNVEFENARRQREKFLLEMPYLFPEMDFAKFEEMHRRPCQAG
jgi:hypothetical protein